MARRDTVWVASHTSTKEEINRIRKYFRSRGVAITIKEASAIMAVRSKRSYTSDSELKEYLRRLRGLWN